MAPAAALRLLPPWRTRCDRRRRLHHGASTINALEAAREAQMTIAAVVCIVEREEANGRPAVEAAAAGAPFLSLFTANDVRAEHLRQQQ